MSGSERVSKAESTVSKLTIQLINYSYIYMTLFTSKLYLNLRKKLVKCYIWDIVLYGAETWTLRPADQKYLQSLKCGAGEGWRRSVGPTM